MEGKTRKRSLNEPICEMNFKCCKETIEFDSKCDYAPSTIIFDSRNPNFSSKHISLEDLSDEIKVDEDIVAMLDRYILNNFASTGTKYERKRTRSYYWKQIDNDIGSKSGRLREYWGRNYGKKTKEGLTWHIPRKGELIRAASTLKMT